MVMLRISAIPRTLLPLFVAVVLAVCPSVSTQANSSAVSLAGQWQFALDEKDARVAGQWFAGTLSGAIHLPGSVDEAGV
jgi:hypothetical protein